MKPKSDAGYTELLYRMRTANEKDAKESRLIHKELRKYGDGLPFYQRYPSFPFVISIVSFVISVITFIVKLLV